MKWYGMVWYCLVYGTVHGVIKGYGVLFYGSVGYGDTVSFSSFVFVDIQSYLHMKN